MQPFGRQPLSVSVIQGREIQDKCSAAHEVMEGGILLHFDIFGIAGVGICTVVQTVSNDINMANIMDDVNTADIHCDIDILDSVATDFHADID